MNPKRYINQLLILTLDVQLPNPFFAQFVIVTKDLKARERVQAKLEKVLAEQFPEVVARVSPLELGPPVGWPLQYRVTGPDKAEVLKRAADLDAFCLEVDIIIGLTLTSSDVRPFTSEALHGMASEAGMYSLIATRRCSMWSCAR